MLRLERFLLTDEQSLVPRSLASVDRSADIGGLRHPALRVALSRAYYFIPTEQSGSPKKVLATDHFWRKADVRPGIDVGYRSRETSPPGGTTLTLLPGRSGTALMLSYALRFEPRSVLSPVTS